MDLDVILSYPLVFQKANHFSGYITANNKDYKINLKINKDNSLQLQPTQELQQFLPEITSKTTSITTPKAYLDTIVRILTSNTKTADHSMNTDVFRTVLNEYKELIDGCFDVYGTLLAGDLSHVSVTVRDECGRLHKGIFDVTADPKGKVAYKLNDGLPRCEGDCDVSGSLREGVGWFSERIGKLQGYFGVMEKIDVNFWVLDPVKPDWKDCYRRIALGKNISVVIKFDPYKVNELPDLKFLGPIKETKVFNDTVAENLSNWERNEDVVEEFLKLLGYPDMPKKSSTPTEDDNKEKPLFDQSECCLCFCDKLGDEFPEIFCSNPSCRNCFHKDCLYKWLSALDCQVRFNEIRGRCPVCEKNIFCPVP